MLIYFIIGIIIIIIIFFFSSPQLSPIPYFPTNKKDLPLIIKNLNLKNDQLIVDLGAGSGTMIFSAAKVSYQKKLNTQFLAVEINPVLIFILHFRRLFHPNKKNIKIVFGDLFQIDYQKILTFNFKLLIFYLYVSPWFLEKILKKLPIKNLKKQNKKITIVSYFYSIPFLKNKEKIIQGKNKIFIYSL